MSKRERPPISPWALALIACGAIFNIVATATRVDFADVDAVDILVFVASALVALTASASIISIWRDRLKSDRGDDQE